CLQPAGATAFPYTTLFRSAWGPVPIVPDVPYGLDTPLDELMAARNTWDECSDYVCRLLEEAIQWLPEQVMDNSSMGRATKNAARSEEHTSELQSRENLVCR